MFHRMIREVIQEFHHLEFVNSNPIQVLSLRLDPAIVEISRRKSSMRIPKRLLHLNCDLTQVVMESATEEGLSDT